MNPHEHHCQNAETFDLEKFFQKGSGKGSNILIVGESPAENGWRKSGKACYTPDGKLLPTGKRLNELLQLHGLSVESCGFTELSKCFVGKDRHLLKLCAKGCWNIFVKQLQKNNPKLIIILGVKTLEIFNEQNNSSIKVGEISKVLIDNYEFTVLPLYHPSPINPHGRGKNIKIFQDNQTLIENTLR